MTQEAKQCRGNQIYKYEWYLVGDVSVANY
jgi:hypothetical protein